MGQTETIPCDTGCKSFVCKLTSGYELHAGLTADKQRLSTEWYLIGSKEGSFGHNLGQKYTRKQAEAWLPIVRSFINSPHGCRSQYKFVPADALRQHLIATLGKPVRKRGKRHNAAT